MEPKIIVLITMLAMPGGDSSINVKPFETVAHCAEAAQIEASDPFVADAKCAELDDGVLMLQFENPAGVSKKPATLGAKRGALVPSS